MESALIVQPNPGLCLKDPQSSSLGQRMISEGIQLLAQKGYEHFTFRKLAQRIGSTEASVYRYFESKHKFLLYLYDWYWAWVSYRISLATANIKSPKIRLQQAIKVLVSKVEIDASVTFVNEVDLHRVIVNESAKAYLVKDVDEVNQEGAYLGYKSVVQTVSDIILEVKADFRYPHMLVSTVVEGAHLQRFFMEHLPRLTNKCKGQDAVLNFYIDLVNKTLGTA